MFIISKDPLNKEFWQEIEKTFPYAFGLFSDWFLEYNASFAWSVNTPFDKLFDLPDFCQISLIFEFISKFSDKTLLPLSSDPFYSRLLAYKIFCVIDNAIIGFLS